MACDELRSLRGDGYTDEGGSEIDLPVDQLLVTLLSEPRSSLSLDPFRCLKALPTDRCL